MLNITTALLIALSLVGCNKERETIIPPGSFVEQQPTAFSIKKVDGVWELYRGEEKFYIKFHI